VVGHRDGTETPPRPRSTLVRVPQLARRQSNRLRRSDESGRRSKHRRSL